MKLRAPLAGAVAALGGAVACGAFSSDAPPTTVPGVDAGPSSDAPASADVATDDGGEDAGCATDDAGRCAATLVPTTASLEVRKVVAHTGYLGWIRVDQHATFCKLPTCTSLVELDNVDDVAITDARLCVRRDTTLRCYDQAGNQVAQPPAENGMGMLRGFRGAVFFLENDKVKKLDDASTTTSDVATGLGAGTLAFDLRGATVALQPSTIFYVKADGKAAFSEWKGPDPKAGTDIESVGKDPHASAAATDAAYFVVAKDGSLLELEKGQKVAKAIDTAWTDVASHPSGPEVYGVRNAAVLRVDPKTGDRVEVGRVPGGVCVAVDDLAVFVGTKAGIFRVPK